MIDLATPALARGALTRARFAADHLQERFALFVIIAIGESIVAIGLPAAATPNPDAAVLVAVVAAFVLIVALWWLYFAQFGHTAAAIPTAMASASAQTDVVRQILVYAHLALIAAIIAIATGIRSVLTYPDQHLEAALAGLLFGGSCLFLVTLSYTQKGIRRQWSPTHLFTAAITAGLLAGVGHVPALAALASLAAVLAITSVVNQRAPQPRQLPKPEKPSCSNGRCL
jgi:low temperature requirement protein LtrA